MLSKQTILGFRLHYWKMFLKEIFGLTKVCRVDICCACGSKHCNPNLLFEHIKKRHGLKTYKEIVPWAFYSGNYKGKNIWLVK